MTFERLQLEGLSPSLLSNRIGIPPKNLSILMEKIFVTPSGCWEWTAAKARGYGVIKIRAVRQSYLQTHRPQGERNGDQAIPERCLWRYSFRQVLQLRYPFW